MVSVYHFLEFILWPELWTKLPIPCRRNNRTGRIKRTNPNRPPPQTYLDWDDVKADFKTVDRVPESHEYLYRSIMVSVLQYFFTREDGFKVTQEESRGELKDGESKPDFVVFKVVASRAGSFYSYDYCIVESKRGGEVGPRQMTS